MINKKLEKIFFRPSCRLFRQSTSSEAQMFSLGVLGELWSGIQTRQNLKFHENCSGIIKKLKV